MSNMNDPINPPDQTFEETVAAMPTTRHNVLMMMAQEVRVVNMQNGWFDDSRRFGEDIALLHSEVSEMLEAYRDGHMENRYKWESVDGYSYTNGPGDINHDNWMKAGNRLPKPEGVPSEAADILIRLLDTCYRYDIDLYAAFAEKLAYNETRGYKHGGKAV